MQQSIVDIFEYLASKDIQLPIFDRTAMQIQNEMAAPEPDARRIESLIVKDQTLTSQVLKVANSSFYKGLAEVTTVRSAIVRLGIKEVADMVTLVAHRSYFKAKDLQLRRRMDDLWRHSVACAIGAKWLAEKGGFDVPANEAFFAALLHDVGKLFIITVLEKLKKAKDLQCLPSEALIDEIIGSLHGKHGYAIMRNWNLPEKYCLIARDHHAEDFDTDDFLLCIVRQANSACHKVGIGRRTNADIVLSATREAGLLGVTDLDMAKLEIHLEDAKLLAA
jgi:HD-like signal output (HDOD) protein